jgi:monothiol glutaredoxin
MSRDVMKEIKQEVSDNQVLLYMKGTKHAPQCGFSNRVVQILEACSAEFKDVNVLADPEKWDAVKTFSKWPTIPQVYINGEFMGGCDIMTDMHTSGDLEKRLEELAAKG